MMHAASTFPPPRRRNSAEGQEEAESLTPARCLKARALLGWNERQLAEAVGCSLQTIRYFEAGNGRPRNRTVAAIGAALERAGIAPLP
ncbi:helix-turn-helix transcriptional regulator [Muricoccus vinaceus]|uniref:Helix-turn-helix transcriptional regulator n=1 Tax=Muricoccus vinaceus TaxID=424704 RepID=A0ABV6IV36_9PROT